MNDLFEFPPVLYEDDRVLVINKPAGLMVHRDGRSDEITLAELIAKRYPDMKEVGEPWTAQGGDVIYRPGIVHRLDKETSGVLVIAKTQEAYLYLKEQFQERKIAKIYNAFAHGNIKEDEGVIDKPIGKSRSDFRRWSAQPGARGLFRDAVTEFTVVKRGKDAVFLELRPRTGRTHQIRVHLKAIHHPIIGDELYAPGRPRPLGLSRCALHARSITLALSESDIRTFETPLPEDMAQALAQL